MKEILDNSISYKKLIDIIFLLEPQKSKRVITKISSMYADFCKVIRILNKSNDKEYVKFMKGALLSELKNRVYENQFLKSINDEELLINNVKIKLAIQQRLFALIKYRITHE